MKVERQRSFLTGDEVSVSDLPSSGKDLDAVVVHFRSAEDRVAFLRKIGESPRAGDVVWYPREHAGSSGEWDAYLRAARKESDRRNLLGRTHQPEWLDAWEDMPEYDQRDLSVCHIEVKFRSAADRSRFLVLFGENPERKPRDRYRVAFWYPKMENSTVNKGSADRYKKAPPNKYPVYVISKGRWDSRLTSKALENLKIPYRIVVEPQEYDQYASVISPKKILVLPFSNLGQGSIPARNWVWEHSLKRGDKRHWILDDNIDGFYRLKNNFKHKVTDENPFAFAEEFSDRYRNVAMSGLQYDYLVPRKSKVDPFRLNTRIYSCILILNEVTHRWRGRYNEDTDLSLRVLKDGYCTVLFNAFLADKVPTLSMTGGNMTELYQGDGRLKMAESLREQHPTLVKVVWKWGRWQHQVNYSFFKKNKLIPV